MKQTFSILMCIAAVMIMTACGGEKEDVYFLLAKDTELNLNANFTRMLDAIHHL